MPVTHPFLLYLRSRLNVWISGGAAALIVLSLVLFPAGLLPAVLILAAYAVSTLLLFFSRKGAQQVVVESGQDRLKIVREKIGGYSHIRERIAVLRIGDEDMRKAVELFLLQSGAYIEKCRELDLYSPRANKRIEDVRDICQAFLGEMDESSTERRYGLQNGESFEDFRARSVDGIMHAASDIKTWAMDDLPGVSGEDRLAIIEELEGRK
jgi:hypothetical protein